jgi:hypothetical protein
MNAEIIELSLTIAEYYSKIFDNLKSGITDVALRGKKVPIEQGIATLKEAVTKLAALLRAQGTKQPSLPVEVARLDFEALEVELNNYANKSGDRIFRYAEAKNLLQYKNIGGVNCLGYNDEAAALDIEAQDNFCIAADDIAICIRLINELSTGKPQPSETQEGDLGLPSPPPAIEKQPFHFARSLTIAAQKKLHEGLVKHGFLATETLFNNFGYVFGKTPKPADFEPLKWIKTNNTANTRAPNKKSVLDLLAILKVPEGEIIDRPLLNQLFTISRGRKLKANNYSYLNGELDTKSEYHDLLSKIVKNSLG